MKTASLLLALLISSPRPASAELTICLTSREGQPDATAAPWAGGGKLWVGKPLATFPNPVEVNIERRMFVAERFGRGPTFFRKAKGFLITFGFTQEQLKPIAAQLPVHRTSILVVLLDGTCIGYTPGTRDLLKHGFAAGKPGQSDVYIEECKLLQAAGITVKGSTSVGWKEREKQIKEAKEQFRTGEIAVGTIEDLICGGKVDNPLQAQVSPAHKTVLCREPVQASLSLRNIGVDQSAFWTRLRLPGILPANLKAVSSTVLEADPNHSPPAEGEEPKWLSEGESTTVEAHLTRALGCEYARAGTGPLSLQMRLQLDMVSLSSQHNMNAWLDLPAPEVTVVALEEAKFTEIKSAAVTGTYDKVQLGTHPLEGKAVTVAVYSKAGKVGRILRLDPNAESKTWELAWDAKSLQLHILQHGTKARYWMSAADQLGWEVRVDVPDYSRLETSDGAVRRAE